MPLRAPLGLHGVGEAECVQVLSQRRPGVVQLRCRDRRPGASAFVSRAAIGGLVRRLCVWRHLLLVLDHPGPLLRQVGDTATKTDLEDQRSEENDEVIFV